MKVTEAIGILFFMIILVVFIGAGTMAGFIEAWEHGQISGTSAFLLIIALIVILLITIGSILLKMSSWRSDDE